MRPVALPANQPADRFYAGGRQIAALRGTATWATHEPEDWVASTTAVFGQDPVGLTVLPDGGTLRDAIEADPVAWLGADHVAAFGSDPALLVKLLDAGQRLPVHAHPDVPFAAAHLGLAHGKTEAWVVLEPARVHLGFTRDVGADELAGWVADQATDAMLGAMHTLDLAAGDAVLVPAGLPHAIGEGALVVELQEPTDLSILLEWDGFAIDGAAAGHLGLGFDVALAAVDRRGWSPEDVARLRGATASDDGDLLPGAAPFFRVERWAGSRALDAGFAVVVVVDGSGTLAAGGAELPVRRGATVVVPASAGPVALDGAELRVVVCRPPAPAT
ncbi:class I mannose-6-phosphate isomerase [Cellulomonas carbonis]|uniref:Phosphohexomutase n=1 Tax=Cellulomonas carbonis T26 TaxID=947969 RepID=A0A0A0BXI4_9CELL|nr:class I mannose-6-phosphate isomerase [Cellulomonas carbonis]KGM12665.1 carbohydrate kinase [Cellulomonas carbonis T26]GGC06415.1 mannose-6-phosphate isomerase [Cellulomonas carbonis]